MGICGASGLFGHGNRCWACSDGPPEHTGPLILGQLGPLPFSVALVDPFFLRGSYSRAIIHESSVQGQPCAR